MSVIFSWSPDDFQDLLETCEHDGMVLSLIHKHMPKESRILESGCGPGRYVKYLHERGWSIVGLEWSKETLNMAHNIWPTLNLVVGDCANSPFREAGFDGVISLGVVEHWVEGPEAPLRDIYRLLKPGGVSIVAVPFLNKVRQWKRLLWWNEIVQFPKALLAKCLKGKKLSLNRTQKAHKYAVYPAFGQFFEYRMTIPEFLQAARQVGFEVVEHWPYGEEDGIYHELNPFKYLVGFSRWKFRFSPVGNLVKKALRRWPFLYCHMQIVVVRKP